MTILQPSLHACDDFIDLALAEAESYGANVGDLMRDGPTTDYADDDSELLTAIDRLSDMGLIVHYDSDSFIVHFSHEGCGICEEEATC